MSLKAVICPSILSSDFACLADESRRMLSLGADWLHLDIMDGHFVPNLTFGPPIVKCLRKHVPDAFLDCHCMVSNPAQWVPDLAEAGASQVVFHIETMESSAQTAQIVDDIKSHGMRVGVALKPNTSVQSTIELLQGKSNDIDMFLVMSVEPGFGGQSFMADMMGKVSELRILFPDKDIQVDGGVAPSSIDQVAKAGANVIVAGSAIFKSDNPGKSMSDFRGVLESSL